MRTRTLLLLAVLCGLAILVAGGIKLLTVSEEADAADLPIGATASAGDLSVTVLSAVERDGRMIVEVRVGGTDDPSGLEGFTLLVGGEEPMPVDRGVDLEGASPCDSITVDEQTCDLVFDIGDPASDLRVLRLRRGEDQRRWALTAASG
jgi:hypothetical protein